MDNEIEGLNDKQVRFCQEYLIDLNATQAAKRSGYSQNTARQMGTENLSKPVIAEYIATLKAERLKEVTLSQQEVLEELRNFAYSDITDTMELTAKEIKALPVEVRRMITSFKRRVTKFGEGGTNEEETVEIRFIDKVKVFEMLNKHIGFYEEDNRQSKPEQSQITINHDKKGINLGNDEQE
jgi:phage terminase small subunit